MDNFAYEIAGNTKLKKNRNQYSEDDVKQTQFCVVKLDPIKMFIILKRSNLILWLP